MHGHTYIKFTEEMLVDRKNDGKPNTPEAWMYCLLLLLMLLVRLYGGF